MGSAQAWHRFVRMLLACAALGVAVAPERARAEYAEVGDAVMLVQAAPSPRALRARAHQLAAARARARVGGDGSSARRFACVARTAPVRSRLYVHKRSFLL